MVTQEEFGSLVAEYEGFRDTMLDEITGLREDIENLREELKELKQMLASEFDLDRAQRRLVLR